MRADNDGFLHLTYCTNIHPGDGWDAVAANVRQFAPALRREFAPRGKFGIGLRLSAREARELLAGNRLGEFRSYLDEQGLYVALINGFPHGSFHGTVVKAEVYAPDWRQEERVRYTLDLIEILKRLLPEGMDGGVSTVPLSYKSWIAAGSNDAMRSMTHNVVRVAQALERLRSEEGKLIHLDIEPEPDCLLENSAETIDFFERWLIPQGRGVLGSEQLLEHVRVCFDCCHFAVEYEDDPAAALGRFAAAGIRVGRVQLSSALDVALPDDAEQAAAIAERLRPFADSTYLHQVIERRAGRLSHFSDLGDALSKAAPSGSKQWRIHFHVPLFTSAYDGLGSTQSYVRAVLKAALETRFTSHLEIETYTWDVLPADLKLDLLDSISREYRWVLGELNAI